MNWALVVGGVKILVHDSRPPRPRALLAPRRTFASDSRCFRHLLEPLNTAEHRVVRIIGDGDRAHPAARPRLDVLPGGRAHGEPDDRAASALASQ